MKKEIDNANQSMVSDRNPDPGLYNRVDVQVIPYGYFANEVWNVKKLIK